MQQKNKQISNHATKLKDSNIQQKYKQYREVTSIYIQPFLIVDTRDGPGCGAGVK